MMIGLVKATVLPCSAYVQQCMIGLVKATVLPCSVYVQQYMIPTLFSSAGSLHISVNCVAASSLKGCKKNKKTQVRNLIEYIRYTEMVGALISRYMPDEEVEFG